MIINVSFDRKWDENVLYLPVKLSRAKKNAFDVSSCQADTGLFSIIRIINKFG